MKKYKGYLIDFVREINFNNPRNSVSSLNGKTHNKQQFVQESKLMVNGMYCLFRPLSILCQFDWLYMDTV